VLSICDPFIGALPRFPSVKCTIARPTAVLSFVLLLACGSAASPVIPETSLGTAAKEWLFAHNQGDGHAMVHFTLGNRGSAPMNGSQIDSTVYDGVRFARELGPLEPVELAQSSDSALAVLLRSRKGDVWKAQFTPAAQPSPVRVKVEVARARPGSGPIPAR
jgi:hypothetical protein